ncbi:MAG TPA: hypothetical protein VNI78_11000 [Vicinamibacterales bacterium]|nr:hypothetical protein [Vicinamibacterales bacterium]
MSATLRKAVIRRRRKRREKRAKLRRQLARASATERQAIEAKLLKTYPIPPSTPVAPAPAPTRTGR